MFYFDRSQVTSGDRVLWASPSSVKTTGRRGVFFTCLTVNANHFTYYYVVHMAQENKRLIAGYLWLFNLSNRINKPRGINQPPLPKKCNLKKGGPPGLINPPIKKPPVLKSFFLSNNFYFQFYLFPICFYIFSKSSIIVILKV